MSQKLLLALLLLVPASQAADFLFATHKLNVLETESSKALDAVCGNHLLDFDINYLSSNNDAINKTTNYHINKMLCEAFHSFEKCDFGEQMMSDTVLEKIVEAVASSSLNTGLENLNHGDKNCGYAAVSFEVKAVPQYFGHYHGLEQIMIDFSEYQGGAHEIPSLRHLLLTPDGKRLEYDDLFLPDSAEKLQPLLVEAWNNREEIKMGNGFPKDEDSDFPQTNNLLFTAQGLMVHYQHYEIASFAEGDQQLVIPYEKLKGILKDKYLPLPNETAAP
jgi:hypothetical protein